jgi:hypothetical protein
MYVCTWRQKESRRLGGRHLKPCAVLVILSTISAPTVYFLSSYSPSLQATADRRKVRGTKSTGQRKSARQGNDVPDKENSPNPVTSAGERPRPRPIKKSTVPEHAERNNTFRGESDRDEGAAMAVEALLSMNDTIHRQSRETGVARLFGCQACNE